MKNITSESFPAEVASGSIVVQFWSTWCGPCGDTAHLEAVESANVPVGRVNVEENEDLAASLGVIVVPTYLAYRGGVEVCRLVGTQTPTRLVAALQ